MKPTIVVTAYNRPRALRRLLDSLGRADYPPEVRLVIAVDAGGEETAVVRQIAADFPWPHGEKEVVRHRERLGLIGNVFFGGGLSREYGAVILLEDDLVVSPMFYRYAQQALACYAADPRIAGIALNALWFNGYTHLPFVPYLDASDVFFMQVAWFQGQAYTGEQWAAFVEWRDEAAGTSPTVPLHEIFATFPETEWFPLKTRYLAENGRFYVFPRQSLTTNFGDAGAHFQEPTSFFQVPLQTLRRQYRLCPLDQSAAVYDSFQEMAPACLNRLTDKFHGYDYAVDVHGVKSAANLRAEYALTGRRCRQPLHTFGRTMWPPLANVVAGVSGDGLRFGKTADLDHSRLADWLAARDNRRYYNRGRRLSRGERVKQWLAGKLMGSGHRDGGR